MIAMRLLRQLRRGSRGPHIECSDDCDHCADAKGYHSPREHAREPVEDVKRGERQPHHSPAKKENANQRGCEHRRNEQTCADSRTLGSFHTPFSLSSGADSIQSRPL